jgi:diadenosine tetraphosphate (Ap4A) HIT family hydrolase
MNENNNNYKQQARSITYAPWRERYNTSVSSSSQNDNNTIDTCKLCDIVNNNPKHKDVVYQGAHSAIILNIYPYVSNGAHVLIVPYKHIKHMHELSSETYHEINELTQKTCALFAPTAHEICINTNQGLQAGASIPDHHHRHIIVNNNPRCFNLIDAIEQSRSVNLQELANHTQLKMEKLHNMIVPQPINSSATAYNCYCCTLITQYSRHDDYKNLIIHRGKHAIIILAHQSAYFGEINIIPYFHNESLETMSLELYDEINELTLAIYPLLLNLINAQDNNIGLISYGALSTDKHHIRQRIIPRRKDYNASPITESYHLNGDIVMLYNALLSAWKQQRNSAL